MAMILYFIILKVLSDILIYCMFSSFSEGGMTYFRTTLSAPSMTMPFCPGNAFRPSRVKVAAGA